MKVSSKIVSGFLLLMLVGIGLLYNQLAAVHQMQAVNRDLSQTNVVSATTVLQLERLIDVLGDDSKKYFTALDPLYEGLITGFRNEFLQDLDSLRHTAKSD